ncbi:hypothetical protein L1049_020526 [Liquidambar formosana]|uniref:DUF4378 domain-containing protein n=1 Tax=Liquidambar formosana TaxID=63359 RepID=A0AAP0X7E3_LIQFO
MGREWYWGGSRSSSKRAREGGDQRDTTTPSGCMSAVFQFFDFHQFQLCIHQQQQQPSFLPEEPTVLKGVEAPRNSLESEDASMGAASLSSSVTNEEENLHIPMGIQIKTSGHTRPKVVVPSNDFSSESSYSPGPKTPNLVARLMGLDLLPENYSPSSSSSNHGTQNPIRKSHSHRIRPQQPYQIGLSSRRNFSENDISGTRSLPETPRISLARRSDVEHRLSLQINKENISVSEELGCSRYSTMGRRRELKHNDENRVNSPSRYAREIVKQVKESVGRKVGLDITNTERNRELRRDEHVMAIQSKKFSKVLKKVSDELSPGKHSTTPSCSPRLKFLEPKNKPVTATLSTDQPDDDQSHLVKVLAKTKHQSLQGRQQQKSTKRCRKVTGERFGSSIKKSKQEETFVRLSVATRGSISEKKCKKTPLSNGLVNITVPTLLPVKKDPSPPATKLPQKQVPHAQSSKCSLHLSGCSSQKYEQQTTHTHLIRDNQDNNISNSSTTITVGGGAEFQYVTKILKRTGIEKDTGVSFTRWFSPSHPLDPSIFHLLENCTPTTTATSGDTLGQLSHQCNRKLIFHLIDEILVDILKPYINMKPWACVPPIHHDHGMKGSQLIEKLCTKIRSFPLANCQVLQDIDALIERDLHEEALPRYSQISSMAFEEEGEAIVLDIERDIMDTLVHETVELCGLWHSTGSAGHFRTETGVIQCGRVYTDGGGV